jgi:hypothetical protein
MNNIYDDVDKTLDFINFEGYSDDSQEILTQKQPENFNKNILESLANENDQPKKRKSKLLDAKVLTKMIPSKHKQVNQKSINFGNTRSYAHINSNNDKKHIIESRAKSKPISRKMISQYNTSGVRDKHLGIKILNRHMRVSPAKNGRIWLRKTKPTLYQAKQRPMKSTLPINSKISKRSFHVNHNDSYTKIRTDRSVDSNNFSTSGGRIAWWRKPNQNEYMTNTQKHMFDSLYERMSRSVPRKNNQENSSKVIYLKNQRTPTLRSFQMNQLNPSDPMKSIRTESNISNTNTEQEKKTPNLFQGVQFRTMPTEKSKNIHMSWVEKKKIDPYWNWGKRVATSSSNLNNSNLVIFRNKGAFCIEDMENRLVHLFMKMLVYSSKIESLKDKLFRGNPNFSSGPLFNEFTTSPNKVLMKEDFAAMLNSFGFNMSPAICNKIILFLSKYRHTHKHHKIRSLHSLPQSSTNLHNILSPLDQPDNLVFKSKHDLINETDLNYPSTGPLNANHKVSSQLDISNYEKQLQNTLNFEDFREFLEKLNTPEVKKSPYLSREGVAMRSMDYHLIRQIIILLLRKLEDLGSIIQQLQNYGSLGIFAYLLKFNPSYIRDKQIHSRVTSTITSPLVSLPNSEFKKFMNNYKPPKIQKPEKSVKRPNSINRFMRKQISKQSKAKILGRSEDSEDSKDDLIIGIDTITSPHRNFASIKNSEKCLDYLGENLNDLSQDQLREKARLLIKDKRVIDEDTIRNFLEFHRVQHMPKDLTYILSDLGTRSLELDLEMFDRFLFSDLWSI